MYSVPEAFVVVATAIVVIVVIFRHFYVVFLFASGRTVGDEMVHGFAVVAALRLRSHCAFGCYVICKFTAVVASVE